MPIEQVRALLLIALAVMSLLIWQAWRQDYAPKPSSTEVPAADQAAQVPAPGPVTPVRPDVPDAPARSGCPGGPVI